MKDYSRFLTSRALRRRPSPIRALQPLTQIPGMVSLGGGMPNAQLFPIEEIEVKTRDPRNTQGPLQSFKLSGKDLEGSLQYSPTPGLSGFVDSLKNLQKVEHKPPSDNFELSVGTGSQDVLAKAFDMLVDENSSIIVESPTYSGALSFLQPTNCHIAEVSTDENGLIPSELASLLQNWPSDASPKPKVLYTIPTGANPTGATQDLERRKEIYTICRNHDILILEDDPYYYLQFSAERVPSFFSMDEDERVLRFDSFSKLISSGLRIGFVTGPKSLVQQIDLHSQASNLHACGVAQAMTNSLLNMWGVTESSTLKEHEMFEQHVANVRSFYQSQRDLFIEAAEAVKLDEVVSYGIPSAGMFSWMKLKDEIPVKDTSALLQEKAPEKKFLMVPGTAFFPGNPPSTYVRASFSTASGSDMKVALERFKELLTELA